MNLEDRIKRRLLLEHPEMQHDQPHPELDMESSLEELDQEDTSWQYAVRVAALEAEDTANPIAASAVVRPALDLTLDLDAFNAATGGGS